MTPILLYYNKVTNENKKQEESVIELKTSYLSIGDSAFLFLFGKDLMKLERPQYEVVSNELIKAFKVECLFSQDSVSPYYQIKDDENIDLFIYETFFANHTSYKFNYILNKNIFSRTLQEIFGNGFWTHTGYINIEVPSVLYCENIRVDAPDIFVQNDNNDLNLKVRENLAKILSDNDRFDEKSIQKAKRIIRYGIPWGSPNGKIGVCPSFVDWIDNKISSDSILDFTVIGKKSHPNSTLVMQYNGFEFGGLDGKILGFTNQKEPDNEEFQIECIASLSHGINSFFLTNNDSGFKSVHPLGSVMYDSQGPEIDIGYYIIKRGSLGFPGVDGRVTIECHNWEGEYKPMTLNLDGDVDRLYIDGKRFVFDSRKNPQEIYRRVPVRSYIGHNRVEVIAYDRRGNRTTAYWEFEAVAVD